MSGSGWEDRQGTPGGPGHEFGYAGRCHRVLHLPAEAEESLRWNPDSRAWGAQRQADSPFAGVHPVHSPQMLAPRGPFPPGQHGQGPVTKERGLEPAGGSGGSPPGPTRASAKTPADGPRRTPRGACPR